MRRFVYGPRRSRISKRLVVNILLCLATFLILFALASEYARALDGNPTWVESDPILLEDAQAIRRTGSVNECMPTYVTVTGSFQSGYKCLEKGENITIDDSLTSLSIGLDNKQYKLNGVGPVVTEFSRKNFVPGSNILITRSGYTFLTYSANLTIESNILKSLTPIVNPLSLAREFNYVYSPDFTLSDGNGPLNVARGLGYSQNGRWIVVEVMNLGLVRIDVKNNYKAELFSTLAPQYYVASNPQMTLAISDDGKHAAVGGFNSPFLVYQIDDSCTKLIDPTQPFSKDGYTGCPERSLWGFKGADQFSPHKLKFSAEGFQLSLMQSFNHWSNCSGVLQTQCENWRMLRAAGYTNESKIDYLALGDSYSSGEGDTERNEQKQTYYLPHTDVTQTATSPAEQCHISSRSYPFLLRYAMQPDDYSMQSIACSGALTDDVLLNSDQYYGQGRRFASLLSGEMVKMQTDAMQQFIPGRVEQVRFVEKYKPKAVTLTIGGNDVGFGMVIEDCARSFLTCSYANADDLRGHLGKAIKNQFETIKRTVSDIQRASPNTKIFVLGYPEFIYGGTAVCGLNVGMIDSAERTMITKSIEYLNDVISAAARATGVVYIDIQDSLAGGRMCELGGYVTGVMDAKFGNTSQSSSFHPNAKGHAKIALRIKEVLEGSSLLTYAYAQQSNTSITAPLPTEYFADAMQHLGDRHIQYKEDVADAVTTKGGQFHTGVEEFSFKPGSNVTYTLHSEPLILGSITTSQAGSIDGYLAMPAGISAGYHTLVLSGETYTGDPIDIYQVILVRGASVTDIDDDGIVDQVDGCLFIPQSGIDSDLDGIDDACDPSIEAALASVRSNEPGQFNTGSNNELVSSEQGNFAAEVGGGQGSGKKQSLETEGVTAYFSALPIVIKDVSIVYIIVGLLFISSVVLAVLVMRRKHSSNL